MTQVSVQNISGANAFVDKNGSILTMTGNSEEGFNITATDIIKIGTSTKMYLLNSSLLVQNAGTQYNSSIAIVLISTMPSYPVGQTSLTVYLNLTDGSYTCFSGEFSTSPILIPNLVSPLPTLTPSGIKAMILTKYPGLSSDRSWSISSFDISG